MPVFEVTSRVTRRSLMNRTKDELASRVLELMDELDRERARREAAEAKANLRALEKQALRNMFSADLVSPEEFVREMVMLRKPVRDADLPQVVSPHP